MQAKKCILKLLIVYVFQCCCAFIHTNQFAVKINGTFETVDLIAKKYGFINRGQIGSLQGYYLFESHKIKKRSTKPSTFHSKLLENDLMVQWSEQQVIKKRVKRSTERNNFDFIDPLYPEQWFLHEGAYKGYDMNVIPCWKRGYTGKDIVVSILDDGIQRNHPDLSINYDKNASWDINDSDDDPSPADDEDNRHGTRCAGEVAAVANNEFCGVGIAYNAKIGGVRMLDGTVTDAIEAKALSLNPNHIQIYSASWGPEDDGKTVDGPGHLAKKAFQEGILKGRNGLGSIFVWASGNGGKYGDNCNCDGYATSIYTISVSSATQSGYKPWYLEECSSTIATTYSSGATSIDQNIVTVDVNYKYLNELQNGKPDASTLCTRSHTGTSASAPIAAALCALALEANPTLTWRDLQYIIVLTSRYKPLYREHGWLTNGVGRKVSTVFGYGLMDADAMVQTAEAWTNAPSQHICSTVFDTTERLIPSDPKAMVEATLESNGCQNTNNAINFLEHVQVKISLTFHPRGNLHIKLTSPSGTVSALLQPRPHDRKEGDFNDWPFMSVHFWGEKASGVWKLTIINDGNLIATTPGMLRNWSIIFYGTEELPAFLKLHEKDKVKNPSEHPHPVRGINYDKLTDEDFIETGCRAKGKVLIVAEDLSLHCINDCPTSYYQNKKMSFCHRCDTSCSTCYGPSYNNCLSCPLKYFLLNSTCVKSCPEGYFASNLVYPHMCIPCVPSCASCSDNINKCTSCKNGHYLLESKCLPYCPVDVSPKSNSSTRDCGPCLPGRYLWNNTCSDICPTGYFAPDSKVSYECLPCHPFCKECYDYGPFSCSSCYQNATIVNSTCIPCIDGEFYDENQRVCKGCHKNCGACFGPLENHCLSCILPLRFHEQNHVCLPCCHSIEKEQERKCCRCTLHLDVCIAHSQAQRNVSVVPLENSDLLLKNFVLITVGISIGVIILFLIIFFILQYRTTGWCHFRFGGKQYMPVPCDTNVKYNSEQEKVALTQEDFEEEDDLFEKI